MAMKLGDEGESLAASFLKKKGYHIVQQNFRTRIGEIDIIAEEGGNLVCVEVKTRESFYYGRPFEAVDARKKER